MKQKHEFPVLTPTLFILKTAKNRIAFLSDSKYHLYLISYRIFFYFYDTLCMHVYIYILRGILGNVSKATL